MKPARKMSPAPMVLTTGTWKAMCGESCGRPSENAVFGADRGAREEPGLFSFAESLGVVAIKLDFLVHSRIFGRLETRRYSIGSWKLKLD